MEPREVKYQCSLYADDVILFIKPFVQEATAVKEILHVFGEETDLKTNLAKCSVTPIYGGEDTINEIVTILGCQVQQFPIKYLGLPLSKKIPKAEYHSLVKAVTRKMPTCHGSLMARSGRLIWIKSVLWDVPIYSMMADSLPPWVRKEIDSICRRFLWVGKDASVRGKCLVVWAIACRPMELGGLGITDLKLVGYALQTRWLWLRKTYNTRTWSELLINTDREVQAFFKVSTYTAIGDGRNAKFWDDRWNEGDAPSDIAPNLVQSGPRRIRKRLTMR